MRGFFVSLFLNFPISCVDNGFIVKAQLVVAACFLEITANEGRERETEREERGKSGEIKRGDKGERRVAHGRIQFI